MESGHRAFAAFWEQVIRREGARHREKRHRVVSGAHGRVLEIGAGLGANWQHLGPDVEYIGIEPDPFMRARAAERAARTHQAFELIDARAEALPFEDKSFDSVFGTYVFCTIPDAAGALREVERVLKPGGEFRFWEHLRPEGRFAGPFFELLDPAWSRLLGGCHPNRRTVDDIEAAGFRIRELRASRRVIVPDVTGVAVKS
ncbi:MAG: methyltransferase domain-containing protein [Dehalococcoidia bacterium]|nr:methyltransferase domain-containing protein [Dehalococcoidia bacterium]